VASGMDGIGPFLGEITSPVRPICNLQYDSDPFVNHLLFADDCLLFFGASTRGALRVYCYVSGQRIKKDKSAIFF
jgi:hypothetical protein